jgi:hypothetical protein
MIDALASPRGMLRRARQQIGDLDAQIKSFMKEKPWSHVVAKDADGVTDLHKIKFTTRLSEDLPHIVFEAANKMRSALDQLGFTVANLTGKIAPKSCKFPMGPTETEMRNNAKGGCKDLPPEVTAVFMSLKPYKGGNNALWALNEFANTPKHKMLIPVALSSGIGVGPGPFWGSLLALHWDGKRNEIVFGRAGPSN